MKNIRLYSILFLLTACTLGIFAQKKYINLHVDGKTVSYAVDHVDSLTFTENAISLPGEVPAARITATIRYEKEKATVYNIEYPSTDPYGLPVTLSGSIVVGDEILDDNHAVGTVLYNHFTVYHKNQCPSRGDVMIPLKIVGSKMLCVASDYYGFGATGDKSQAYCIPSANGQASVDCLIAARQLLANLGFTWDDVLLNLGYSEGGQTSMAVLRYIAQRHPDIKVTHTLAGGGPYDISETYRQMMVSGTTAMPSTVVNTVLAYNEFYHLGYLPSELFIEPALTKIKKYLLSKEYKQQDIELNIGSEKIADWASPVLMDFSTDMSKRFMDAFQMDILTKNWTPRSTDRITLVHNKQDAAVPVENCTKMEEFLKEKGFKITLMRDESYADGVVHTVYCDQGALNLGTAKIGAHELGALFFLAELNKIMSHYLGINFEVKLTMQDLANF